MVALIRTVLVLAIFLPVLANSQVLNSPLGRWKKVTGLTVINKPVDTLLIEVGGTDTILIYNDSVFFNMDIFTDSLVFNQNTTSIGFPSGVGLTGQLMKLDGDGNLSWANDQGAAGGDNAWSSIAGVLTDLSSPFYLKQDSGLAMSLVSTDSLLFALNFGLMVDTSELHDSLLLYLPLAGGTMTGAIDLGGNGLTTTGSINGLTSATSTAGSNLILSANDPDSVLIGFSTSGPIVFNEVGEVSGFVMDADTLKGYNGTQIIKGIDSAAIDTVVSEFVSADSGAIDTLVTLKAFIDSFVADTGVVSRLSFDTAFGAKIRRVDSIGADSGGFGRVTFDTATGTKIKRVDSLEADTIMAVDTFAFAGVGLPGSGGTTDQILKRDGSGNMQWASDEGAGSAVYGEIYVDHDDADTVAIPTGGTYVASDDWITGDTSGVTVIGTGDSVGRFVIKTAGDYLLDFSAGLYSLTAAAVDTDFVEYAIFKNSDTLPNIESHRDVNRTLRGSVSLTGIETFAVDDTLDLRWTSDDNNDTIVIEHMNFNISLAVGNVAGAGGGGLWDTLGTDDTIFYAGTDTAIKFRRDATNDTTFAEAEGALAVDVDKITISGDNIIDFAGDGLSVSSNALVADLGTSIVSGEIVDQTIVKADIDTTSSNVPFDGAYHITTAEADSAYVTAALVGDSAASLRDTVDGRIDDSLANYVPLAGAAMSTGAAIVNLDSLQADTVVALLIEADTVTTDTLVVNGVGFSVGGAVQNQVLQFDAAGDLIPANVGTGTVTDAILTDTLNRYWDSTTTKSKISDSLGNYYDTSTASATYLKIDASNDPLTGDLAVGDNDITGVNKLTSDTITVNNVLQGASSGNPVSMPSGATIDSGLTVDTITIGGDAITDFAGTGLTVDGSGVLNASGGGSGSAMWAPYNDSTGILIDTVNDDTIMALYLDVNDANFGPSAAIRPWGADTGIVIALNDEATYLWLDPSDDSYNFQATWGFINVDSSLSIRSNGNDDSLYFSVGDAQVIMKRQASGTMLFSYGSGKGLIIRADSIDMASGMDMNGNGIFQVDSVDADNYKDQTVQGDDIDSVGENFAFDGAYHITTAVADSSYVTAALVGDTADILRAEMGDSAATVRLDEIQDPAADLSLTMSNKSEKRVWSGNPSGFEAAIEYEFTGAPGGDIFQIHQKTGNPGALTALFVEVEDSDVMPLRVYTNTSSDTVAAFGTEDSTIAAAIMGDGLFLGAGVRVDSVGTDTLTINGDLYTDLTGQGMAVTGGALGVTDDIANHTLDSAEVMQIIADTTIKLSDMAAASVDSTKIADGDLSIDDINWEREYIELTIVHGWDATEADSTTLFLSNREGYTPILFVDSTNVASKKDTVYVTGAVPYDCTVDSVYLTYKVTGASVLIDSLVFRGPDLSSFTNLCDSTYASSGTNLTSTSVARLALDFGGFTASAGHRFGLLLANDLAADDGTVKVYSIQLAVTR
jgi:hypothetical protein